VSLITKTKLGLSIGKGKVKGLGKIALSNDLSISNVLLVESLNFNLLSETQLCDLGFKCIFEVDDIEIISETSLISMKGNPQKQSVK
jgi:hypothetical protein